MLIVETIGRIRRERLSKDGWPVRADVARHPPAVPEQQSPHPTLGHCCSTIFRTGRLDALATPVTAHDAEHKCHLPVMHTGLQVDYLVVPSCSNCSMVIWRSARN
jgi:hypothetical protein